MCKGVMFMFLHLIVIVVIAVFLIQVKTAKQQVQAVIENGQSHGASYFSCSQLSKTLPYDIDYRCCTWPNGSNCESKSYCYSIFMEQKQNELSDLDAKYTYEIILEILLCVVFLVRCCKGNPRRRRENEERIREEAILARLIVNAALIQRHNQRMRDQRSRYILVESLISEEEKSENCAVCLDAFEQQRVVKLNCQHIFHMKCISEWIKNSTTCPVCRAEQ